MTGNTGLTPFALGFMLFSMTAVTALMLWCFYRIMTSGSSVSYGGGPSSGPEPEGSGRDGP